MEQDLGVGSLGQMHRGALPRIKDTMRGQQHHTASTMTCPAASALQHQASSPASQPLSFQNAPCSSTVPE